MMNTFKNTIIASMIALAVIFTISSCQKGFDHKTYAPTKPPPNYGGYTSTKEIAPDNLVAYWPFNGSVADSLSQTTGTATGTTSFATGLLGQGLKGADKSYVLSDVPAALKALQSFTISTWVNMPQNTTGAIGLIDIDNNQIGDPGFWGSFTVFFDNGSTPTTGVLKVHVFNDPQNPKGLDAWEGGYTVTNPWNTWINITVTYNNDESKVTVFYNGNSVGDNTVTGFAPLDWSKASKMVFGTLQFQTTPSLTARTGAQDWASFLTGTLDQVRVYNTALTSTEVNALYNLEKAGR